MRTPACKKSMSIATLLVVVLAACGRGATASVDDAAAVVPAESVDDGGEQNLLAMAERRHFAIYSTYRVLFADTDDAARLREDAQDDGLQKAADLAISSCSPGSDH